MKLSSDASPEEIAKAFARAIETGKILSKYKHNGHNTWVVALTRQTLVAIVDGEAVGKDKEIVLNIAADDNLILDMEEAEAIGRRYTEKECV